MNEISDLIRADMRCVEDRREQMRKAMPGTAAIVDEFRAAFGQGVKVLRATEGDKEVGKPQPFDGTDVDKILLYHELRNNRLKRNRQ